MALIMSQFWIILYSIADVFAKNGPRLVSPYNLRVIRILIVINAYVMKIGSIQVLLNKLMGHTAFTVA